MSDSRDDLLIAIRYALLKKGAKQKFSLFFLIIVSLSIIILDRQSFTAVQTVRSILNDFVNQVNLVASTPGKLANKLILSTKNHFLVYNQNQVLKEEIEIYKNQNFNNAFLKTENNYLKNALGLQSISKLKRRFYITARVTLDQESPFLKSLIINKGSRDKIVKGMSVFSKNYLIGTVIEANFLTSRVLLITDLNSKIPVIIQDSDANAILTGTGEQDDLRLEYLPEKYILEDKKIIFTSGKAGFLDAGIPIAETYLNKKNELKIRTLADPQQAMIISLTHGQIEN